MCVRNRARRIGGSVTYNEIGTYGRRYKYTRINARAIGRVESRASGNGRPAIIGATRAVRPGCLYLERKQKKNEIRSVVAQMRCTAVLSSALAEELSCPRARSLVILSNR